MLREVAVPIVNNSVCKNMFGKAGKPGESIPKIFLCAGWENGGHDACQVSIFLFVFEIKN